MKKFTLFGASPCFAILSILWSLSLNGQNPPPTVVLGSNAPFCVGAANLQLTETGGDAVSWKWSGPNNFTSTGQNPILVAPAVSASGTYNITITDGNGTTATGAIAVTILPRPVIEAGADRYICSGGSAALSSTSNGVSCFWQPVSSLSDANSCNPVASPATTTLYTLTATATNGCTNTDAVQVQVHQQSSVACNNVVTISLDQDGIVPVMPNVVLAASSYLEDPFYTIKITGNAGQNYGNIATCALIGLNLTVRVTDTCSGISCTAILKVEDKLAPKLTCVNLQVPCILTNLTPTYLAAFNANAIPAVQENCTMFTRTFTDTWTDLSCTDSINGLGNISGYVLRQWNVADTYGNTNSCLQYVYLVRSRIGDLVFPPDTLLSCNNAGTNPLQTGAPYVTYAGRNFPVYPDVGNCELNVVYEDFLFPVCDGSYKIKRTWTVYDWCLPTGAGNPFYYSQLVKISDTKGPVFVCPADLTVSTDPFNCCAIVDLPDVIMTDNCSRINNIGGNIRVIDPKTDELITTVSIGGSLTTFADNNLWLPDTLAAFGSTTCLPRGTHIVTYRAEDDCGNSNTCIFNLTVKDLTPPVASCTAVTKVALGIDGTAMVDATVFDQGSTDNCGGIFFKARRMDPNSCQTDTLFRDQVRFCCSDIGDTIRVVLRVYDTWVPGDTVSLTYEEQRSNSCMIQVLVEDKLPPACVAPANITTSCESFDASFWAYGTATGYDNCCLDTIISTVNYSQFDTICDRGTITRTFRAYDCNGLSNVCTQKIVSAYDQDYYLKLPDDKVLLTCDGTGNFGVPVFFGEDCELLAYSYADEIFTVVPDACFKIERTWKIINWCTYNPNAQCIVVPNPNPSNTINDPSNFRAPVISPPGTTGFWAPTIVSINPGDPPTNFGNFWQQNANCYEYKQIIKILDTQDPVIHDCPTGPVEYCDLTNNNAFFYNESYWWDADTELHDVCEGPADLRITASDACSGIMLNFRYLLYLDLDGNGSMETVINSVTPPPPGIVYFGNANNPNFSGGEPRVFHNGNMPQNEKLSFKILTSLAPGGTKKIAAVRWSNTLYPDIFIVPEFPAGTHKIKWFVEDGCGNEKICEYDFTIKDCKKPTVVCHNGLSVNIMPTGMIQLWANDFLLYAEDNCTPANKLKFGIRKSGTGIGFPLDASGNPNTSVIFTCNELGTQPVELWAIDLAGNASYCETYILVQDNNGNCAATDFTVAGAVQTESASGVQDATVTLKSSATSNELVTITDAQGRYMFSDAVPTASSVTLRPTKDGNYINGVSTFDLVLISKHILGIEPLTSPYKMIASDANNSGSITTYDIVELRKLVLGIYTELPGNSSWRFVDKDFVFPQPANPWQTTFPESRTVAVMQGNQMDENFVAIKIGDVSGNVVTSNFTETTDRSSQTLLFEVTDRLVQSGETFSVQFSTVQLVEGYQFTLQYPSLEIIDVQPGSMMRADNFAIFNTDKTLTTSWEGTAQANFRVTFRSAKTGWIHEMLNLSSRVTKAEAYQKGAPQPLEIALRFNSESGNTLQEVGFELYQNHPNPFTNRTFIDFNLPTASAATLTVFDETGRELVRQQGEFAKGVHTFAVDRATLPASGILFYQVATPTANAVRKMVDGSR